MAKYSTPVQCLHHVIKPIITKIKVKVFFSFFSALFRINKFTLSFLRMATIIIMQHRAEHPNCLCTSYDCAFSERGLIMSSWY